MTSSGRSRKPTLLVISSDRANLKLMTQLLLRSGDILLQPAINAQDGMELATVIEPHVIVMDTELSDIKAKKLIKTLKANPRTSKIPVIAVSSDAHESQIQEGLDLGFYRYLTKPYKLPDLLNAIDDSLRHSLAPKVA